MPIDTPLTEQQIPGVQLPERIATLAAIATDLSWSWSRGGRAMFARLDPALWEATGENPVALLRRVEPGRLEACARDARFLALYDAEVARLAALPEPGTGESWFAHAYPGLEGRPAAYFCAEFAVHSSVPIYSGGLGVLAGDHCKSASDLGIPLVGVGLFYSGGYFDQRIRADGWQEDGDETVAPADFPLEPLTNAAGDRSLAVVSMFGRDVHVGAWRMTVGGVPIYLLTTELEENHPDDRPVTRKLYAGGPELRLRQEWILGVGGVRVLRALGVDPGAWHANEGHAAFMMIERLRELMAGGMAGPDAVREVRARGVFTTHTPVAAGHDAFPEEEVARCAGPIWEEMKISREGLLAAGRHPAAPDGRFHMTAAAIRLSGRVNGVAARHGEVSREIWRSLWPDRPVERVPIRAVTNGVHLATWMSDEVKALLDGQFGDDWERQRDDLPWERVLALDAGALWAAHEALKRALVAALRERARSRWATGAASSSNGALPPWPLPSGATTPAEGVSAQDAAQRRLAGRAQQALGVAGSGALLDPAALTIGFARRFATYKRADLIFQDLDRLRAIVADARRPVQLVFAGKAHPADTPGKKVLQAVHEFAHEPSLAGRVAFVEDYDMRIAARLVQGVDLWLNLPRVPLEASGTSGMKAALNGIPQLSTLDGWWPEGYNGLNGWAIPVASPVPAAATPAEVAVAERAADAADAAHLYELLERDVVPAFYERDAAGRPAAWIERMKQSILVAGRQFTTRRMLQDYAAGYYAPAMRGDPPTDDPPTA